MKPLEQLRVIDLGLGPITGLATMVLADFGADVIKIEPPGGDPYRSLPSSRLWLRGKSTITVDFHDDAQLAQLKALILDTADGVVTTLKKGKREGYGLDYAGLCEGRPDLIYGSISGFGETGPYADYLGYEGIVAAKSGRMMSFEGSAGHAGPNYAALQVGIHATAQSVAAALMSAFHARLKSGKGFSFETSLLRGLLPYDMGGIQTQQLAERGVIDRPQGRQDPKAAMPRIYYHGARTRDGRWIQFGNLLPHLQTNFLRAAGIEVDEGGIPEGGDALEEFRNRMLARIEQLDLDEWMDIFVSDGGVVAH
ncbi:MAG: CoA transferase, partial [Gammaproteobacteria bacterium]|nr:CoA transferase [Gammaproteobacteria bacterium]